MKFGIAEFNIIVLAKNNNPSLLNPDFLKINDIVPKDLEVIQPICTPPFSQIKFQDHITVTADIERLNFSDGNGERLPHGSDIPSIATKYLKVLRHVPYTAAGINFTCFYEFFEQSPNKFLLNRFINRDIWQEQEPLVGLKLSHSIEDHVTLNLDFNPGKGTDKRSQRNFEAVFINSNFHCEPSEPNLDSILQYIDSWNSLFERLKSLLSKYFGNEEL